jgi:hypothetical protein
VNEEFLIFDLRFLIEMKLTRIVANWREGDRPQNTRKERIDQSLVTSSPIYGLSGGKFFRRDAEKYPRDAGATLPKGGVVVRHSLSHPVAVRSIHRRPADGTMARQGSEAEATQKRRRSDAKPVKVTQGDAEVTQDLLQINGLRGLRRIASHANIFAAKRSRQLRQAEKEESRDWGKSTGWGRVLPDTVG